MRNMLMHCSERTNIPRRWTRSRCDVTYSQYMSISIQRWHASDFQRTCGPSMDMTQGNGNAPKLSRKKDICVLQYKLIYLNSKLLNHAE